jgi:predicted flavoprotein YhiN
VDWSPAFRNRHAGAPLKRIALSFCGRTIRGEAVITAAGIEGGIVYAMAAPIRDALASTGRVRVHIDLRPDLTVTALAERLGGSRGSLSLSTYLHKRAGLPPVAIGLVQEALHAGETKPLASLIKAVPITLTGTSGLARAISTAGGIALGELDDRLMLRRRPGVFAAGEMLDWEAPTGGYLLQACMANGVAAGTGVLDWLRQAGCGKIESPSDGKLR